MLSSIDFGSAVEHVIVADPPDSVEEYEAQIALAGTRGVSTTLFTSADASKMFARELVASFKPGRAPKVVPLWLGSGHGTPADECQRVLRELTTDGWEQEDKWLQVLQELTSGPWMDRNALVHFSVVAGCCELLELLDDLEHPVLEYRQSGMWAIHFAAEYGQVEVIDLLYRHADRSDRSGLLMRRARDRYQGTPAHYAAYSGNRSVLEYLAKKGGNLALMRLDAEGFTPEQVLNEAQSKEEDPTKRKALSACSTYLKKLEPSALDIQTWLVHELERRGVKKRRIRIAADRTKLASSREPLDNGLFADFGVRSESEFCPASLEVEFRGESGIGDGLMREWFGLVIGKLVDPDVGLFENVDGGSALHPSPHSNLQDNHLEYFWLLGRLTGLALYHRVPIAASWSLAFIKVSTAISLRVL